MKNFIFITKKGTKIYRKNNLLYIENKKEAFKKSIPFNHFSAIITFTKLDISTNTINIIASKNKALFLLNRFGKIAFSLLPKNFNLDQLNIKFQYKLAKNEKLSLDVAKFIISMKFAHIIKCFFYSKYHPMYNLISIKKM